MSMWLSGANSIAGSARGRALAEGKRQSNAVMHKSMKEITEFWTGGLMPPPAPKRKKRH